MFTCLKSFFPMFYTDHNHLIMGKNNQINHCSMIMAFLVKHISISDTNPVFTWYGIDTKIPSMARPYAEKLL